MKPAGSFSRPLVAATRNILCCQSGAGVIKRAASAESLAIKVYLLVFLFFIKLILGIYARADIYQTSQ
jgi:hypothetical protein